MAAQGTRPAVDYRGEATVMARMTQRTTRALAAAATSMALLFGAAACTTPSPEPTPTGPTATPTPTRPPIPYVARPSGLIWDSGSNGHDDQQNAAFAHMRGRPLDVLGVAPTRDSWDQLLDDWWLSGDTIPANFKGTLNVAVPLFPKDGSMGAAARGDYDEQWQILGRMIAKRYPTAYVRPGWEMNIHNWDWSANPDNVEQFKEAFRRASVALKKAGPKLRIVWNVNEGKGDSLPDATMAWPGDQYVDIVGMDAYDWHPPYDEKGWRNTARRIRAGISGATSRGRRARSSPSPSGASSPATRIRAATIPSSSTTPTRGWSRTPTSWRSRPTSMRRPTTASAPCRSIPRHAPPISSG